MFRVVFGIAFILSILANVYQFRQRSTPVTPSYMVVGVIDGDTFVIEGKHKIRLRQVQAPELSFCGGEEAKKELEKLIAGRRVKFENEIPDPWGRSMAIVFVDGQNVNKTLIESGTVRYYHDVTPYEDELKKAATEAEARQLGIYAKCETATPPDPKCVIKGNIRNDRDTQKYYLPNCPQYPFTKVSQDLGEKWFCTEAEAKATGFTKAENCP